MNHLRPLPITQVERDEVVALNKLLDGSNDEYRGQLADVVEKEEKLELDMVGTLYIPHPAMHSFAG